MNDSVTVTINLSRKESEIFFSILDGELRCLVNEYDEGIMRRPSKKRMAAYPALESVVKQWYATQPMIKRDNLIAGHSYRRINTETPGGADYIDLADVRPCSMALTEKERNACGEILRNDIKCIKKYLDAQNSQGANKDVIEDLDIAKKILAMLGLPETKPSKKEGAKAKKQYLLSAFGYDAGKSEKLETRAEAIGALEDRVAKWCGKHGVDPDDQFSDAVYEEDYFSCGIDEKGVCIYKVYYMPEFKTKVEKLLWKAKFEMDLADAAAEDYKWSLMECAVDVHTLKAQSYIDQALQLLA